MHQRSITRTQHNQVKICVWNQSPFVNNSYAKTYRLGKKRNNIYSHVDFVVVQRNGTVEFLAELVVEVKNLNGISLCGICTGVIIANISKLVAWFNIKNIWQTLLAYNNTCRTNQPWPCRWYTAGQKVFCERTSGDVYRPDHNGYFVLPSNTSSKLDFGFMSAIGIVWSQFTYGDDFLGTFGHNLHKKLIGITYRIRIAVSLIEPDSETHRISNDGWVFEVPFNTAISGE